MIRGNERDEAAGPVEALHDAYAQALYRYAWSLLGGGAPGDPEDPVTEAVHEGLVAGVLLEKKLRDPADRGPWLYALVRAACQRRGFAHTCPYTRLATMPAETPVAHMFSRLPASHRELVELNLRHAMPASTVARVLGLESRICGELSRSAIRRAAEGLNRPPESSETPSWRNQVQQVSSALSLLRPPGAPPGLRERVVHTCLAPEAAEERKRISAAMHPLTEDGYPAHRARAAGGVRIEEEEPDEALVPMPPTTPRPLPGDRITTQDQPLHEDTRAPLPAPDHDPASEALPERRRWSLPAVSGLATVAVALGLWWWAGMAGAPPMTIDAGPAETGRGHDGSKTETVSTASENKPGVDPSPEVEAAPTAPDPETSTGTAPRSTEPDSPVAPEDGQGPEDGPGQEPDPQPGPPEAPEDEDDTAPPPEDDEAPGEEPEGEEPGGGSGGLLGGLFGLLFGEK